MSDEDQSLLLEIMEGKLSNFNLGEGNINFLEGVFFFVLFPKPIYNISLGDKVTITAKINRELSDKYWDVVALTSPDWTLLKLLGLRVVEGVSIEKN